MSNQDGRSTVHQLLQQQIDLYQSLLDLQKEKIELLREQDANKLDQASAQERQAIAGLRSVQRGLRTALDGHTLEQHLQHLDDCEPAGELRSLLVRLGRLAAETSAVNLRNFRHVQTAMAYNQAILEQGFGFFAGYGSDGGLDSRQSLKQQHYRY